MELNHDDPNGKKSLPKRNNYDNYPRISKKPKQELVDLTVKNDGLQEQIHQLHDKVHGLEAALNVANETINRNRAGVLENQRLQERIERLNDTVRQLQAALDVANATIKNNPSHVLENVPVKNFRRNQSTEDRARWITQEETVRAHSWTYTEEEKQQFKLFHNDRCPSYGNCLVCAASGPVGLTCGYCQQYGQRYVVWMKNNRIYDAEKLSTAFGRPHQQMNGNYTYKWIRTPCGFPEDFMIQAIYRMQFPDAEMHNLGKRPLNEIQNILWWGEP